MAPKGLGEPGLTQGLQHSLALQHCTEGRGWGGAAEGLSALLGEKSLPEETRRVWHEGETVTLGWGMEPQLYQSGTPA